MKFSKMSEEEQKKILIAVKAEVFMQNYLPLQHAFYIGPIVKAFEEVMEEFEKEEKKEESSREVFFPDPLGGLRKRR